MSLYDVAIVGAGPAGAATAIRLAGGGRSVLLVDKSAGPGRKPCGEALFGSGAKELRDLKLNQAALEPRPLSHIRFHAGGNSAEAPLPGGAIGVRRGLLQPALWAAARSAGVELRAGTSVIGIEDIESAAPKLRTAEGAIEARIVVAADGLHSRLRRETGLASGKPSDRYGVTGHVTLRKPVTNVVDIFIERGYELYVTPVSETSVNVALLLHHKAMLRFKGDTASGFRSIVAAHPFFRDGFDLDDKPLVAGPFARATSKSWKGSLLLAGDAAGFLDGISGDGMSAAFVGAHLCADAVDAYLTDGDITHFRDYDRKRRHSVRDSNLLAHTSLLMGSNPLLAKMSVRNLGRRPATFAKFAAINSREMSITSLRPRDVLALAFGL